MPIRAENRARYPKDWKAISERIRFERAANRCECEGECGGDHGGRCAAVNREPHPDTLSMVVLTVAHLDHVPENCGEDNLKAMCQRCHNRYDMPMRRAGIATRARALKASADLFAAPVDTLPKGQDAEERLGAEQG
jgi:5-methylcytosine-specific restriction endonuclease McrA